MSRGDEAEPDDACSSYRSCSEEVSCDSSAADADLDWISGETAHGGCQVGHDGYYLGKDEGEGGEDADEGEEIPPFMASTFSNVIASDLASQRKQGQESVVGRESSHAASHADGERRRIKERSCCICGDPAVYTCPCCGARTCSIICVRIHKKKSQCTGERDIAKKIPLSEFTDGQLQRDFHFLEDVRLIVSNCRRGFSKLWRYTFRALPPPLHALREAAKKRGVVCQITSEGMTKRDANTSRFDRRTETITWRCQFNFHNPNFSVSTDWGNERQRLGDIAAFCWSTKPPLPCFHINRQYNRASKWIGTVEKNEGETAEMKEEEVEVKNGERAKETGPEEKEQAQNQQEQNQDEEEEMTKRENSIEYMQPEDGDKTEIVAESIIQASGPVFLDNKSHCEEMWSPIQVSIPPLSPVEQENEEAIKTFLSKEPAIILARAERLGMQRKYFRMSPSSTLNEALRTLFFINEFPVFEVIHASELDAYPLVTEADKEHIRESFRAAPRPPEPERRPRRTRADLSAEEAARYAQVPCRMFLAGCCKLAEGECPYWHCEYRDIPACRSFVKFASCEKGDRCSFRHDSAAVGAARKRAREERQHPSAHKDRRRRQ